MIMHGDEDDDASNVFAIPDFWKSSTWLESTTEEGSKGDVVFALDVKKKPSEYMVGVPQDRPSDGYFRLPPLLNLPPVPDLKPKPEPVPDDGSAGAPDVLESEVDDLWLSCEEDNTKQPRILTWVGFNNGDGTVPTATFMTEASSAAFDALLAAEDNPFKIPDNTKYDTVDPGAYSACLLSLALGRSSLLYAWNAERASFAATLPRVKLQGYSGQTLEGLSMACKDCGESTRYLQSFVEKIYAAHASPTRTALAKAVGELLLTIQSELGVRAEKIRSLLQLQALVQPVRSVLVYFRGLVKRLARSRSDEQLISMLFEEAHSAEYSHGFLRNTVYEVLRMVSRPWTDFVEEWIGLRPEEGLVMTKAGPGRSFVKVANKMWVDDQGFELEEPDYFLDEEAMPSFVPEDIAQEIFETGRNLRFLRANHPEHRLACPDYIAASNPPKLEWQFDWDAISRVERMAKEYEEALMRFLERGAEGSWKDSNHISRPVPDDAGPAFQFYGKDESQIAATLLASMHALDEPVTRKSTAEDGLRRILAQQLFAPSTTSTSAPDSDFNPHWSLLPRLSFGAVIAAQAKAINTECTRLLFTAHSLRAHLHLQRQYHLLGNGLFCTRLSHALFDPDLDPAERRPGVALGSGGAGVMGLRLSGRDTWPPASSELRLALMGVLAESYEAPPSRSRPSPRMPRRGGTAAAGHQHSLLLLLPRDMDISFAVRDLSPAEIEACVDAGSLAALDFLRLSYKPPAALRAVLTPVALAKYDRAFRLLLRVLRVLHVADGLFRDVVLLPRPVEGGGAAAGGGGGGGRDRHHHGSPEALCCRFRAEAHHFVSRLAAYLFETGVGAPWARFEAWLDGVEGGLDRYPDSDGSAGGATGFGGVGGGGGGGATTSYGGPDRLRERHERALDEILAGLLLRRRQRPVMGLVEEVFGAVLGFARVLRRMRSRRDGEMGTGEEEEIRRLYSTFRKKVDVFITVCRGMSEKGGGGGGARSRMADGQAGGREERLGEENSIDRLLLLLDMSGHFGHRSTD